MGHRHANISCDLDITVSVVASFGGRSYVVMPLVNLNLLSVSSQSKSHYSSDLSFMNMLSQLPWLTHLYTVSHLC